MQNSHNNSSVQELTRYTTHLAVKSTILILLYFACLLNCLAAVAFYKNFKETKKPCCGVLNLLIFTILESVQNFFFFIYEIRRLHMIIKKVPEETALTPVLLMFYTFYALGNVSLFLRNYWILFLSCIRVLSVLQPMRMKNLLTLRMSKIAVICLSGPAIVMVALRYYLDLVRSWNDQSSKSNTNRSESVSVAAPGFDQVYFALQSALPPTGVILCSALTIWKLYMTTMSSQRGSHAARTVLAVCVVFFLCQYPPFIVQVTATLIWSKDGGRVPAAVNETFNIIIVLDSCLNFFIFVAFYPSFNVNLASLIRRPSPAPRKRILEQTDDCSTYLTKQQQQQQQLPNQHQRLPLTTEAECVELECTIALVNNHMLSSPSFS